MTISLKQVDIEFNIYEPHGKHKSKTYNKYTKNRKEHKHITKENHQTTREETRKKNREELQKQPENK